ncbi:hypothetical protein HPT25_28045 [Bacillus sp. BRMEA1]|uniref:hypothetical protein n=1 Tax=Neobacillus endophyticus TaxID=2738405 RepID=UPI001565312E|nr:hypothetical protein [Neobacillus endophyticus]NRD81147.1 hypothetical protein [Neobacillus endophyticus]
MERDPKTGRFLPGNQAAVGNQGNRKPKWGNKNALKHGLYGIAEPMAMVQPDGNLYIWLSRSNVIKIGPEGFIQDGNGRISIRNDIAPLLEERGFKLEG